jgi:benzylsuccinate CoA-transferase BbsF subunit
VAAQHAAFAALAALHYRNKTGKGQYIELSQWESLIGLTPENIMDYTLNGTVRTRQGNRHDYMAPHNAYPCAGGPMKWVTIAVETDEEWQAMCNVMGNPEWAADKKYADAMGRWEHQEEMDVHIAEWTRQYTNYDVTRMLQEAGVAAFPTLSNRGLTEDPHLNARGFFFEITDHPEPEMQGRKCDGLLWKMSRTPGKIRRRAPMVGEHNRYVFGEFLGMPQSDIDRLVEEKVLF